MQTNALYQTLVEALESQLAPRVVSRLLREGMAPVGATPETLTMDAVEAVLRGPVFRQLQTTGRGASGARDLIRELEEYVRGTVRAKIDGHDRDAAGAGTAINDGDGTPPPVAPTQAATAPVVEGPLRTVLSELQTALRPLNLYFSWPEVRKLRSLVQVAEDELARGVDATVVVTEAEAQLQLVHLKLEDQLVLQARTLADLESVFEAVASLGTPGVRRLDALIATVRDAQARRTLVEAETERAEKLARELRKLVESTILDEHDALPELGRGDGRPRAPTLVPVFGRDPLPSIPPVDGQDAPSAAAGSAGDVGDGPSAADVRDRLHALDLEGEVRDLESLAARHAELVRHEPALAEALESMRAEHRAGRVLGERIAQLERDWTTQTEARRHALRTEFEVIRAETEALPPEVDTVDLRHALIVALDLLEQTLPAVEDVATVRELRTSALGQSERLARALRERSLRWQEQRSQIAAVRGRLDAAWHETNGEQRLRRARENLQAVLATLHDDAVTEEHAPVLLETALDAEAAWQRAVAEASDDQTARQAALVRALSARVAQLPELAGLRARTTSVQAEVDALDAEDVIDDARLHALTHLVEQLCADARAAVAKRLDAIAREAGEPAPVALLRALQAAARQLDEGGFPDLNEVEREVALTHDVRRAALRRRYLRARQEARRLAEAGVPAAEGLLDLVGTAREAVESDAGAPDAIDDLELRTGEVEREVAARLAGFEKRLDAALSSFQTVARLNNDDVAAVRRVLMHLDDQRDAVGRVSPGLQAQLFESLTETEATLEHLEAAFEATRAVADQLVSGGRLDDLLGAFDSLFDAPTPAAPARAPAQAPTTGLTDWLDGYLGADDVAGAILLNPAGQLLAGRVPDDVDVAAVGAAIGATVASWGALGERLGDEAPGLVQIDIAGRPTWLAPLEDQGCALVWCARAAPSTGLGARLRDDRHALLGMLRGGGEPPLPPGPANAGERND